MLAPAVVLAGLVGTVPAADAVARPAQPLDPQPIVGGYDVELGEFDAVVSFLFSTRFCSGTIVAPRLVLTAAHCLANLPPQAETQISVRLGTSAEAPAAVVESERIGVYPGFCSDCLYERHDLGYILLQQDVEIAAGFPDLITDQQTWDTHIGDGKPMTMVGFGQTEAGDPSLMSNPGLGTKRAVDTTMRPHGSAGVDFLAGSQGIDTCDGDSGGPALVLLADGRWAVAGVLSGGLGECGSGDSVYSVPLPALAWIRDDVGIDLLPASCEDGDCIDMTIPPKGCGDCRSGGGDPSPLGVVLAWLCLALTRGRRRRWTA
jgi:MYXO-CTERM domain-containing protein